MKRSVFAFCGTVALAGGLFLLPAFGEAPVKIAAVAPVDDLAKEAEAQLAAAEEVVASDEFSPKKVAQAGGVLACLGQAIAEHPDNSKVKIAGADLREAAIALSKTKSADEAKAALGPVKDALAGKAGSASADGNWAKLANMHRVMEEVNFRNSRLRRLLRRPGKDANEDARHATTLAVLALAIEADTHEVKYDADVPQWKEYSRAFGTNMTVMADALRKKDMDAARAAFTKANQSCNDCHTKFREE